MGNTEFFRFRLQLTEVQKFSFDYTNWLAEDDTVSAPQHKNLASNSML